MGTANDVIEALESWITKRNLTTIDEKLVLHTKLSNKSGSWVSPGGDVAQTARQTTMETKFMVIISTCQHGHTYFNVLQRN